MGKRLGLEELREIIDEFVDLCGQQITRDALIGTDIPIDSQQMLRIISRIEGAYRLRFTPQDLLSIRTIGDLLDMARSRAGMA